MVLMLPGELEERLRSAGAEVIVHNLPQKRTLPLIPFVARSLARRLRPRRPVLVHANGTKSVLLGVPLARGLGAPLLWMKHGHDFDRSAPRVPGARAATTSCASRRGWPEPFPTGFATGSPWSIRGSSCRRSSRRSASSRSCSASARSSRRRGHDTLIRALAMLRERGVEARIEIAGPEHRVARGYRGRRWRSWWRSSTSPTGSSSSAGWTTWRRRTRAAGRRARQPAGPRRNSRGGRAACAARGDGARAPVVGPDEAGVAEIVGEAGILIGDPTPTAFADALEPFLRDPGRAIAAGPRRQGAGRAALYDRPHGRGAAGQPTIS